MLEILQEEHFKVNFLHSINKSLGLESRNNFPLKRYKSFRSKITESKQNSTFLSQPRILQVNLLVTISLFSLFGLLNTICYGTKNYLMARKALYLEVKLIKHKSPVQEYSFELLNSWFIKGIAPLYLSKQCVPLLRRGLILDIANLVSFWVKKLLSHWNLWSLF